jgi:hypothetical protein
MYYVYSRDSKLENKFFLVKLMNCILEKNKLK